ncbi:hypothetical protein GBF38_021305 [Nibea albiflora]|uniref:Uncharacterized protein n=1 Tax=Nibea albiflora TaxID=240163 RepID=A0ACB7FGG2_NIBAL|nr:hypothetical protein GBF38_021305 [Nibea albiflora]
MLALRGANMPTVTEFNLVIRNQDDDDTVLKVSSLMCCSAFIKQNTETSIRENYRFALKETQNALEHRQAARPEINFTGNISSCIRLQYAAVREVCHIRVNWSVTGDTDRTLMGVTRGHAVARLQHKARVFRTDGGQTAAKSKKTLHVTEQQQVPQPGPDSRTLL